MGKRLDMSNDALQSVVCVLHFERGIEQQKIAAKFGLSKMTVSRMVQRAQQDGLIQLSVKLPFALNSILARKLVDQFKLEEAVVVKANITDAKGIAALLSRVCAYDLGLSLDTTSVLGLGVGATMGHLSQSIIPMKSSGLHVVQLIGGLTDVGYNNPLTIVQETCRKLHAAGTYFVYPAILPNRQSRDMVLEETDIGRQMRSLWSKCDTAIFGVGDIESGYLSSSLVSSEEYEQMKALGVVADVLGHPLDQKGEIVATEMSERLLSIDWLSLKKVPNRVAVAGGENKIVGIGAALKSGIVSKLYIDERTAGAIVAQ